MAMIIQCDFDGTITVEDMGFFLLDTFAAKEWREWLKLYQEDRITVGEFNSRAFATVRAAREEMIEATLSRVKLREGFSELLDYCRQKDLRIAIVSNGLDFYIDSILASAGLDNIETYAAKSWFRPGGLKVKYIGPDGIPVDSDFKSAYTRMFLKEGYRVAYIGNGPSDINPALLSNHTFAREGLLEHCQKRNLPCRPFNDFYDVIKGLESL